MKEYDVVIVGAGPGGIYASYELLRNKKLKVAIIEKGHPLTGRHCPIDGEHVKTCAGCSVCSIMCGFGGAGAFSDGKFLITNDFGGSLYTHVGKERAMELMEYVDSINLNFGGAGVTRYSTKNSNLFKTCMQNNLTLLSADVRHFGTDINYKILQNLYNYLIECGVDFYFDEQVLDIASLDKFVVKTSKDTYSSKYCIVSAGRSGSTWVESLCKKLGIETSANKIDLGVRVELPYEVFSHITDELYEGKIVYRTKRFEDDVRTFCMNPRGLVVNENTDGIITVNGHSFEGEEYKTNNTNFALLVSKHFTEPFNNSNEYGNSIAKLSNMLGGGVIVQQFGDLIRGRRTNADRLKRSFVTPTLNATPGDLSLVLPKRILDGIIEMIFALDKIAPGTANQSTLLYGVEVKSYNMEVEVDENLESKYSGLYFIGDGSGITHSLSHASASGISVARNILKQVD